MLTCLRGGADGGFGRLFPNDIAVDIAQKTLRGDVLCQPGGQLADIEKMQMSRQYGDDFVGIGVEDFDKFLGFFGALRVIQTEIFVKRLVSLIVFCLDRYVHGDDDRLTLRELRHQRIDLYFCDDSLRIFECHDYKIPKIQRLHGLLDARQSTIVGDFCWVFVISASEQVRDGKM